MEALFRAAGGVTPASVTIVGVLQPLKMIVVEIELDIDYGN